MEFDLKALLIIRYIHLTGIIEKVFFKFFLTFSLYLFGVRVLKFLFNSPPTNTP